jgi:hypothetical protein
MIRSLDECNFLNLMKYLSNEIDKIKGKDYDEKEWSDYDDWWNYVITTFYYTSSLNIILNTEIFHGWMDSLSEEVICDFWRDEGWNWEIKRLKFETYKTELKDYLCVVDDVEWLINEIPERDYLILREWYIQNHRKTILKKVRNMINIID